MLNFIPPSGEEPTIDLNDATPGSYIYSVAIGNEICGTITQNFNLQISEPPVVELAELDTYCEIASLELMPSYPNQGLVDSVFWQFPAEAMPVEISNDLDPGTVTVEGAGDYSVSVSVFNACGEDSVEQPFTILQGPDLDISLSADFICAGGSISTTNNSTGDGLQYTWSYTGPGDISISNNEAAAPTFDFTGTAPGQYTITVEVGNEACDPITQSFEVEVSEAPVVELAELGTYCEIASLELMPTYPNQNLVDSVFWQFPAGAMPVETSNDFDPGTITVEGAGDYSVSVSVFNACGEDMAEQPFTILQGPDLDISLSADFICAGGSISTTNNSSGDGLQYTWSYTGPGDINISNNEAAAPTFDFTGTAPGQYTITVEVSNEACDPITQSFEVEVSEAPVVELAELDIYCEIASLELMPTYPNQNLIDSVFWQFPAGAMPVETSNDFDPGTITVEGAGDYSVSVSVFNACGEDTAEQPFTILQGPDLDISLSADFICAGGSISATNNSSGDGLQYTWSYTGPGDINISNNEAAAPTFDFTGTAPGQYTITVEVSNEACDPITQSFEVEVSEVPVVELAGLDIYCEIASLELMPTYPNQNLVDSVFWQFPAGAMPAETSNDFDPGTITVEGAGDYSVSVSVFNACGEDSVEQPFTILQGPMLDLAIPADTLCTGSSVMVENNSTGDQLAYTWTYDGDGDVTFSDITSPVPEITFPDTGVFVLNVLVENPVCDPVSWSDTIWVLELPTVSFPVIPDDCGETTVELNSSSVTIGNPGRLDSIRWTFPGGQPETSADLYPGVINYDGAGSYTVTAEVFNFCGTNTFSQSFQVLQPIEVDAQLSSNFSCDLPFTVNVENFSSGDQLNFEWSVAGPFAGNVSFDPMVAEPSFVFQDTGLYVITQTVFNDICGELTWSDTVTILAAPVPLLTPAEDFCESAVLLPEVDYQGYRIDSVLWDFPGGTPENSTDLFPAGVSYAGAGTYTYTLTAYNSCGSSVVSDEFVIDTIPVIDLGPTDTICITDGLYNLPTPSPAGGIWQDSLGQPGIVTQDGVFDPEAAGGGVTTLEYIFTIGACEISTYKQVLVIDLSYVDGGDPLDACISLDTFQLSGASPAGGWYTGPGVIDSTGLFAPSSLAEGCYTLTYFFQLPGTDCIQGDEVTVCVRPLPVPDLASIDSLCVDVATPLLHQSQNAVGFAWSINDSLLYEVETPIHTFADTGWHLLRLDAVSEFGCVDSASTDVYVSGPPVTQFEMDTTMGCAVLPITFTNNTIGFEFVSYNWDFGNGGSSTEEQPGTIAYEQGLQDTTYFITLQAENHCGESAMTDSVLVLPLPLTNFQASQYAGCSPLDIAINNNTQGLPESFLWEITSTDGFAVSYTDSIPPDQVFLAPDSTNVIYNIRLYAFNECGTDTLDQQVLVKPNQIRAFFSVPDNEGCEPFEVDFLNTTSPDSALVYNWYFGDGNTSNQTDTTYTYVATGDTTTNYTVTLVADNGCARDSAFGEITVFPAPLVAFETAPYACLQDSAFFHNTSVDVNGTLWDFGDGSTSTTYDAYYAYPSTGTYTVSLTAYAAITGCPNTFEAEVEVQPLPNPSFMPDVTFGCPPLQVGVENTTTDAEYYVWYFGDGNSAVGQNPPPHVYQEPGFYDIRLEATDIFGCSNDTIFSFVNVYPEPVIDFEVVPDEPCGIPQEVCILNQTEYASGFSWSFGNGSTSVENAPCTVFNETGTYTISLTAQNEFLCTQSAEREYTVYGIPFANFSPMDTTGCEPFWLRMDNQSEYADYALWQFGNVAQDSSWDGTHVFRDTGQYDITLIVGNGSGCADTLMLPNVVNVQGSPQAGFTYDKLDNELGSTYQFFNDSSPDAETFDWSFGDGATSSQENPVHRYLSSFDKEVRQIVRNEAGCPDTAYALIDLDTLSGLFVPNVLEPATGTSLEKQVFLPKGIGLSEYEIAVYARTGQLIWSSTALNEEGQPTEFWDGTLNGQDLPAGVFVWKVHRARFYNNTLWDGMPDEQGVPRRSGFLYLVR
jgi:PKD repeat protein